MAGTKDDRAIQQNQEFFKLLESVYADDESEDDVDNYHQSMLSLRRPSATTQKSRPSRLRTSSSPASIISPPKLKDISRYARQQTDSRPPFEVQARNKEVGVLSNPSVISHRDPGTRPSSSPAPSRPGILSEKPSFRPEKVLVPPTKQMAKKRKRPDEIQRVPENRQIFKGFSFFFIPNSDISPIRRIRIRKTIEYGANWVRLWHDGVTHIIVDRGITREEVFKHLEIGKLPTKTLLLDESWLLACLQHKCLVQHDLSVYQVESEELAHKAKATESKKALQLKPERRRAYVPDPETPSRGHEDETESEREEPSPLELKQEKQLVKDSVNSESEIDLEQAIAEIKLIKDLPLDSEDTNSEPELPHPYESKPPRPTTPPPNPSWQSSFTCMQPPGPLSTASNPNAPTIAILTAMHAHYTSLNDTWRMLAYRRAISTLRRQTTHITTEEAALRLPGIGSRLAAKIAEIASTGRLRRLENAQSADPADQALKLFLGIYSVGLAQASRWAFAAGYRTLDDLLAHTAASLTESQKIGIAHYADFQLRIPRDEVAAHAAIVRSALEKIDPSFQAIVAGSFRRGAPSCGDIDVIIFKPGCDDMPLLRKQVFSTAVSALQDAGFLVARLASRGGSVRPGTVAEADGAASKWHGASVLPASHPLAHPTQANPWRRIDLLLTPFSALGAALLYFTGDDVFNRSMRLLARRKGMCLNQRGLFADVLRRPGGAKVAPGRKVAGETEEGVFSVLGVGWREPGGRVCG